MSNGTVKWFNAEKVMDLFHRNPEMMYLFIFCNSGKGFKTLEEGQSVSFEIEEGPRGKQASNVTKL